MEKLGLDQVLIGGRIYKTYMQFKTIVELYLRDDVRLESELDKIDREYYASNDAWLEFLDEYFLGWIKTGRAPEI